MILPVSVIIPTFNRAHTIKRALDSVYSQSMQPNEVIVVDDGSMDNTATLIEKHYPNVRYLYQANTGVSHSRNRGTLLAQSEWVAFLDSDDSWHKKKLEFQYNRLLQDDAVINHTDEIWLMNNRRINPHKKHQKAGGYLFNRALELCLISPSSVIIKRDFLIDIGLFNPDLPACEDYDLWLRITCQHNVSFVDQALTYKHGGHADQLSKAHWGMDRFRIISLTNLIKSNRLTPEQEENATRILLRKSQILLNGAKKRGGETQRDQLKGWILSLPLSQSTREQLSTLPAWY